MDDFLEQIVERKKRGASEALFFVAWILLVIFAFFGLMNLLNMVYTNVDGGLGFDILAVVQGVVFLGIAFLLWRAAYRLRTEYDYSFTNGIIDVAQVMNRRKRRYLTSVKTEDLRTAGEVGSSAYQACARETGVKLHKWYLNRDEKLHFFYFEKKGQKHLMLLELNEEMVKTIFSRRYMPVGVWDGAYKSI